MPLTVALAAAQSPKRFGGIIAIIVSIVLLLIGGTLLGVGIGREPDDSGLFISGAVLLAVGAIVGAIGLYFVLAKKEKSASENLPDTLLAPAGSADAAATPSAFDETERAGTAVSALGSDAKTASIESSVQDLQRLYNENPAVRSAVAKGLQSVDKNGQLQALVQRGGQTITDVQKFLAENPGVARAANQAADALKTKIA